MKISSIRFKLITLVLVMIVPLYIYQFVKIVNDFKIQSDNELQSNVELAQVISDSFENYIEELWIQESIIGKHVIASKLSKEEVLSYFTDLINQDKTITEITWIDSEGTVTDSTQYGLVGKSLQFRDYFQKIQNGNDKVISDLVPDIISNKPIFPVLRAIKKDGRLIGVVSMLLDSEELISKIPCPQLQNGGRFSFVDTKGMIVYRSDHYEYTNFDSRRIAKNSINWGALKGELVKSPKRVSNFDKSVRMVVAYPMKQLGWVCNVSSLRHDVLQDNYTGARNSILILILVSLVTTGIALFFGSLILRPLGRLKNVANMIMHGDYTVRTNITGNDEIAVTAQIFDHMAEGIEQYDKLKNQFFSNLSHELKTPLNVIFASTQLIMNMNDNIGITDYHKRVQKYMKIVKQNCYRLMRLIGNLIDITRYDGGFLQIKPGNHNIVQIIEDITLSIIKYAETKGITVVFDTNIEERYIACDPDMIERVMLNLISNALKFTNTGGNVWVNVCDQEDKVVITVRDSGIGIPSDKLNIIFERFRQVDDSLNRNHEGSGIGLSLVKALVEAHNGTITVNSEYGKGTEVIVTFPVKILQEEMAADKRIRNESKANLVERVNIEFSDIYSSQDF